jgi:sulfoxide reductase heme-binding subunit YedZ
VAGVLAVIHFIWRVKIDVSQPMTYALLVAILLGIRAAVWIRKKRLAVSAA